MCVCAYVKVLRLILPHPALALLESVIFFQDLQFLILENGIRNQDLGAKY